MIAGFARDANLHMSKKDPLADFAVNPPREKFVKRALDELRKASDYEQPRIVSESSRRVQEYSNLCSTFLYSVVTVDGVECPHADVLGKKVSSFMIYFPTGSRLFTSLSLLMKKDIKLHSQAPEGLKSRFKLEDTTNVSALIGHVSTLRIRECRELHQMLARKRRANTPGM